MQLHHIGQAVDSIADAIADYTSSGAIFVVGPQVNVRAQKVRVCFLEFVGGTRLELVEPTERPGPLDTILKRGGGFYHVAYAVQDVVARCDELEAKGYRTLTRFASEAFADRLCAFLFSPAGTLIELVPETTGA